MAQRLFNVRVRPPQIAILIDHKCDIDSFLHAVRFLGEIWGGVYHQLLPVDGLNPDDLTGFRLANSRPEYVISVGVDIVEWSSLVFKSCQPRIFGALTDIFTDRFVAHQRDEFITTNGPIVNLYRERLQPLGFRRKLRLVSCDPLSTWAPFCAVMYGIHPARLRRELYDEQNAGELSSSEEFIALAKDFVEGVQRSWIEVSAHRLKVRLHNLGELSPTIVLVGNTIQDLCLFWNLRRGSDADHPKWIIPIPIADAVNPAVISGLRDWLLAFRAYGAIADYCNVTSESLPEPVCIEFCQLMQVALSDTGIHNVVYEPPKNQLPDVLPFEYESTWTVELEGRRLTILPPRPKAFEAAGLRGTWIVDFVRDLRTRRAVKELQLPPSPVIPELLNGPCPPNIEYSRVLRTGDGQDAINIRCSPNDDVVRIYLPSPDEILLELLRENQIVPLYDEKRSAYLPAINRLGGLMNAAMAVSSVPGRILTFLADDPKTTDQILGGCKLGKGKIENENYFNRLTAVVSGHSERSKRLIRSRFRKYARGRLSEENTLQSFLEFWAERKVIHRKWVIGPCERCRRQSHVPNVDLGEQPKCPRCGYRIRFPDRVPLAYELEENMSLAFNQGLVPVALAGRFLRQMTSRGFFWLPGVKYTFGDIKGDIDILAACDGYLVFCECKTLKQIDADANSWDSISEQFIAMAKIAKSSGGHLAVLAAQVERFPSPIVQRVVDRIGNDISLLFLDNSDLENGHRDVIANGGNHQLRINDLIPDKFPEQQSSAPVVTRTIKYGAITYTITPPDERG